MLADRFPAQSNKGRSLRIMTHSRDAKQHCSFAATHAGGQGIGNPPRLETGARRTWVAHLSCTLKSSSMSSSSQLSSHKLSRDEDPVFPACACPDCPPCPTVEVFNDSDFPLIDVVICESEASESSQSACCAVHCKARGDQVRIPVGLHALDCAPRKLA